MGSYKVPARPVEIETEVKRSKFIAYAYRVSTPEQADNYIKQLRVDHPQANHVCWAYIAGSPDTTLRSMSDDGEPSGTAGMPMLNVLQHSGLGEVLVAVVRYFGGTKLGTGGLQRAYSDAVATALRTLPLLDYVARQPLRLVYDYGLENVISQTFDKFDCVVSEVEYGERISACIAVDERQLQAFVQAARDVSKGKIEFRA